MSIAIPYQEYKRLYDSLSSAYYMTVEEAHVASEGIEHIVIVGAQDALDQAKAYTDTAIQGVRTDVDNSLNTMSAWTQQAIDSATTPLAQDMQTILTKLAGAQNTVQVDYTSALADVGTAITQSQSTISASVTNMLSSVAGEIEHGYTIAGETIENMINTLASQYAQASSKLADIPTGIINKAKDILLPAERAAMPALVSNILDGSNADIHLDAFAAKSADEMSHLLDISEDEVRTWAEKSRDIFWGVVNPMLRPEYRQE